MGNIEEIEIIPISKNNREKVNSLLLNEWKTLFMVVRGEIINLNEVQGMIAYDEGEIVGIITYIIYKNTIEIISLNSFRKNKGIGNLLIEELKNKAKNDKFSNIKLITTNDNIEAIRFYQRRNFVISNIYINSIENARKIKKDIPQRGEFDIPIRDEIEFTLYV